MTDDNRDATFHAPDGKRPYYFDDPTVDQLIAALLALSGELAVALMRIDTLERVLETEGRLDRRKIEAFEPDDRAEAERRALRAKIVDEVLRPFEDYRRSLTEKNDS
ncbi:MAG: hypothetical protein R3E77_09300 [Steroidobacteraceae bacterium]